VARHRSVIVVGLDGLEPTIVDALLAAGALPNLAKLRSRGGYSRVATTTPAQTPVAWSTFATGVNPGGHGIFDFIRRDPTTYFPDLGLNRYEQKNAFLPPKAVNLRRGVPIWQRLADAGIPSTVIRCPCTYPPDTLKGRLLSGMGVPDIRGGLGTSTFYTTRPDVSARESEQVISLDAVGRPIRTQVVGPRNPKAGTDLRAEIVLERAESRDGLTLRSEGQPRSLALRQGVWSPWLKLKFKSGLLQSTSGMVRFLLVRTEPYLELYASPVNFDPAAPIFPISTPWEYASELAREVGTFYTTGMVEDHTGLSNERFGEAEYLAQCEDVLAERERMMRFELDRHREGLFYILFDTPDRLQHMFWRFREPDHPANRPSADTGDGSAQRSQDYAAVIEDHYERCDRIVGEALAAADDRTLVVVLSDHGFNSFQRGVNLNTWLYENGLLALEPGVRPGDDAGEFLREVDWARTQAYALGLGSVFLNVAGRERDGIVAPGDAPALARRIADGLSGLVDHARGTVAVRGVRTRDEIYTGACAAESPDLVVNFNAGYRVSWSTALGGVPEALVEDNVKKWGGDHIIDPALVPGVLFMSDAFRADGARLVDLAPTILDALGAPVSPDLEGRTLRTTTD
jgi:predicted AlkP superfamily phosphohydrolase/phosphomutase